MSIPTIRIKIVALFALVVGLATAPARADVYTFSYVFDNGLKVSGLLDGTPSGDYLNNISVLSLTFDNGLKATTLTAPLFAADVDSSGITNGPIVSFTGANNQFGFSDADLVTDPGSLTGVFIIDGASFYISAWDGLVDGGTETDAQALSKWSLTSIPDTSATVVLLGLGLCLLVWMRRRYPIAAGRVSTE